VREYNEKKRYGTMEYFGRLSDEYLKQKAKEGKKRHDELMKKRRELIDNAVNTGWFSDEEEEKLFFGQVNNGELDYTLRGENDDTADEDGEDGWFDTDAERFAKSEVFDEQYFRRRGRESSGVPPPSVFWKPLDPLHTKSGVWRNEKRGRGEKRKY
jgi:predicted CopG family antitoxin